MVSYEDKMFHVHSHQKMRTNRKTMSGNKGQPWKNKTSERKESQILRPEVIGVTIV